MITVFHPTLPTSQEVPDEAVADWLEQGWLEEQPVAADPAYDQLTASIPDVLKHVGSDSTRAAEALQVERDRGAATRSTLVTQLEKLVQEGSI